MPDDIMQDRRHKQAQAERRLSFLPRWPGKPGVAGGFSHDEPGLWKIGESSAQGSFCYRNFERKNMMKNFVGVLLMLLLAVCCAAARADEIVVQPDGTASLTEAVAKARPGDIIHLAAGVYTQEPET